MNHDDDRELEDLLRRSMRHHAEHMPVVEPAAAANVSPLRPRRRLGPMLVAAASVVVIAGALVYAVGVLHLPGGGSGGAAGSSSMAGASLAAPTPSKSAAPAPTSSAAMPTPSGSDAPHPTQSSAGAPTPAPTRTPDIQAGPGQFSTVTVLTSTSTAGAPVPTALLMGPVSVDASGCVTVGGHVAVWPEGTRAAGDERALLVLPNGEVIARGDRVSGGVGFFNGDLAREWLTPELGDTQCDLSGDVAVFVRDSALSDLHKVIAP